MEERGGSWAPVNNGHDTLLTGTFPFSFFHFSYFMSLYLEVQSLFVIRSVRLTSPPLSTVKPQLRTELVCSIRCPWTSLACVLIKSLLVIPRGARWNSSQVTPPTTTPPALSLACSLGSPPLVDVPFELPSVSGPTSKLRRGGRTPPLPVLKVKSCGARVRDD